MLQLLQVLTVSHTGSAGWVLSRTTARAREPVWASPALSHGFELGLHKEKGLGSRGGAFTMAQAENKFGGCVLGGLICVVLLIFN
jgi:hypothetical protein